MEDISELARKLADLKYSNCCSFSSILTPFHHSVHCLSPVLSTRWTMPEEFRVWNERVDAIERKKREHESAVVEVAASSSSSSVSSSSAAVAGGGRDDGALRPAIPSSSTNPRDDERPPISAHAAAVAAAVAAAAPVVYATKEEAVDAFKAMLEEFDVSATMKVKDVADTCQKDGRFNALKTAGEKKQALAEYQVTD